MIMSSEQASPIVIREFLDEAFGYADMDWHRVCRDRSPVLSTDRGGFSHGRPDPLQSKDLIGNPR